MTRPGDRRSKGDDPEVIAQRERELAEQRLQRLRLQEVAARLMELPDFRFFMAQILARGGMFQSVMTGNSQTYWLSGKQDFAREIWAELARADLDAAHALLKPTNIGDTHG